MFPDILLNYQNRFPDGRPAKSTSIGLKNSQGDYIAAICLNIDISMLNSVAASLTQLTETSSTKVHESLASPGLEALRATLERFASSLNKTPRSLTPVQRRAAVRQLADAGLMDLKNAQAVVADVLGVARSTVYTYLPSEENKT
jgi:predicted transcriptional regulator YheO